MKDAVKAIGRTVAGTARRYFDDTMARQIKKLTGLVPIAETQSNDIFICGYPKSGNTWFQHMAAAVVYGADVELAPDTLLNDLVPDIHFRNYYRRYADQCFFKSHHLPQPPYRRIVYLLRDGRDAMVSYYHHLTAMSGQIDFHDMVANGRGLPGKWHEHVERYVANPYGAEMITIRYEDLKRDTHGQLRRFCEFAGIERTDAVLARAAEKTTFDKMRLKEQKSGWETAGWPKDKPFVRRGVVGSFKDEMPADVLEAFLHDAAGTLSSHGYTSPDQGR